MNAQREQQRVHLIPRAQTQMEATIVLVNLGLQEMD